MVEILLLRHSLTAGNLKGRYIGSRTDEPLCEKGIDLLRECTYPSVDRIYISPMKRCLQTAEIIWPQAAKSMIPIADLRECDFGDFENKNYQELNGNPAYQAWVDSGGKLSFPGGENTEDFKVRCQNAFAGIAEEIQRLLVLMEAGIVEREDICLTGAGKSESGGQDNFCVAIVAHGGTIMSILERYGYPKRNYFDYQVKNGCGYLLTPVEGTELWNYQSLP